MERHNQSKGEEFLQTVAELQSSKPPEDIASPRNRYQRAVDNKMALHFLDLLDDVNAIGPLQEEYETELKYRRQFEKTLTRITTVLSESDVDHCLVKTVNDFRVVPKDVDVLVFEDVADAEEIMLDADYRMIQEGPLARTLIDNKTEFKIDLQEELCLREVKYIDRENIKQSIVEKSFNDIPVLAPKDEMELAIYLIHSLSEQIFVLREFFVVDSILRDFTNENTTRFVDIVDENYLTEAASAFFTIQAALYQQMDIEPPKEFESIAHKYDAEFGRERKKLIENRYKLPHRYTNRSILHVIKEKMNEENFRTGWYDELRELTNPETFVYVMKKLYERQVRTDYTSDRYADT